MRRFIIFIIVLAFQFRLSGQNEQQIRPKVFTPAFFEKTIPLREMQEPPGDKYFNEKDIWNITETSISGPENPLPFLIDPVLQNYNGSGDPARLLINKDVLTNPGYGVPPDPNGDAGPHHYFHTVNVSFVVLDKSGNTLLGPTPCMTLWQNFPNINVTHGDPVTIYDHLADRWLTSIMASINGGPVYYELIAVSESSDPTGSWYVYAYELEGLPDYPKFGLWHDGYYWAANIFNLETYEWIGAAAFACDRQAMLSGDPDARILRFQTTPAGGFMQGPFSFLPSHLVGDVQSTVLPNYFMYFKDDAWGFANDFLSIWECKIDWDDTSACTFEEVAQLQTEAFDSNFDNFTYITQPDPAYKLQSLCNRLMFRLDFRHFEEYDVMVTNHTVDCDATDHAGVRWYELRNYGTGWEIHQQGTYAPDDDHRWMGSMSIDADGNIALGYSVSSSNTFPSVRATGRRAGDSLGIMTIPEFSIMDGGGSQTWMSERWGDYTSMSIDPVDQSTFWYINQYYPYDHDYLWKSALGGFYFASDSGMHTTVHPDTLFFNTQAHMTQGIDLSIINPNPLNSSITYNDASGTVWGEDIGWFVYSLAQAPFFINAGDTHVFNIRAALTDEMIAGTYFYDTMLVVTSLDTHNVILAFSDSLLTQTPEPEKEFLTNFSLFPNPTNGRVNLTFTLAEESLVSIFITDFKGKKLQEIPCGILSPGEHHYETDLSDQLTSGICLVEVQTSHYTFSKKILLIR